MTRKHFSAVAGVIRTMRDRTEESVYGSFAAGVVNGKLDALSRELADIFGQDSARFDRARFLEACGTKPREGAR